MKTNPEATMTDLPDEPQVVKNLRDHIRTGARGVTGIETRLLAHIDALRQRAEALEQQLQTTIRNEQNCWERRQEAGERVAEAESRAARLEAELAARNDELGRYMMANNRLAQERVALRKALMELVYLKDLHDKTEASEFTVTKARQQQEYEKRKPLAWKAARAAIDREKA